MFIYLFIFIGNYVYYSYIHCTVFFSRDKKNGSVVVVFRI